MNEHGQRDWEGIKASFEKYDIDNANKLSTELFKLVDVSRDHGEIQLKSCIVDVQKKQQRQAVLSLLNDAVPHAANSTSPYDFGIETSNALFVYLLEKFAKIKGISGPSNRSFKMEDHWDLIFRKTKSNEIFTKNKSFVFREAFNDSVEFVNDFDAEFVYHVIKDTMTHYRNLKGQTVRREISKRTYEECLANSSKEFKPDQVYTTKLFFL